MLDIILLLCYNNSNKGRGKPEKNPQPKGRKDNTMKQININDRTEVARALNFGEYPVLTIDLADRDEYGLVGCKVKIDNGTFRTGEQYFVRATIRVYSDEQTLTTSGANTYLKASYGYSDVKEMLEWAAAPVIKPNQDVVLAITNSKLGCAYDLYIVRTGSRVNAHCITPLTFEKLDLSKFF